MHILVPGTLWLERLPAWHEPLPEVVEVGLSVRLLTEAARELLLGRECIGQWLNLGTSARDDLAALDLKQSTARDLGDFLVVLFAIFLILLVDVQQQFLQLVTRQQVLVVETRTHAQVQRFLRLFLPWPFFEARALTSQTQFYDVLRVHVL